MCSLSLCTLWWHYIGLVFSEQLLCTNLLGDLHPYLMSYTFYTIVHGSWVCLHKLFSDFVDGGFNEDSGKWRQDNSLCETAAPNSVKNGLVIACFLLAFLVLIGASGASWILLKKCRQTSHSQDKKDPE